MTTERSAWAVGYALFAAVILMIAGTFHFVLGLVGIIEEDFYVVGQKWVFEFDVTTWGWIHLLGGVVLFGSGILIVMGNLLGRIIGIIVAGLSAVVNFMWLPYYPVWSAVLIALDVAIIWALSVHGRDVTTA
jgi:hypothetical protein